GAGGGSVGEGLGGGADWLYEPVRELHAGLVRGVAVARRPLCRASPPGRACGAASAQESAARADSAARGRRETLKGFRHGTHGKGKCLLCFFPCVPWFN